MLCVDKGLCLAPSENASERMLEFKRPKMCQEESFPEDAGAVTMKSAALRSVQRSFFSRFRAKTPACRQQASRDNFISAAYSMDTRLEARARRF